jgi:lipoate-protein ligase A
LYLDLSLPTAAENLACDEALLDACEAGECPSGVLRFWEPKVNFIVLGYANRVEQEVHLEAAKAAAVPIFRRCSGGGTVLQASGCLNYALVLKIEEHLLGITEANRWIMSQNALGLQQLLHTPVTVCGHTDLTLGGLKFSGNAQRRKRHWLLFHGTFLLRTDLELIERVLKEPARRPAYREARSHRQFLTSVRVPVPAVRDAMCAVWKAREPLLSPPGERIGKLVIEKYSSDLWNLKW